MPHVLTALFVATLTLAGAVAALAYVERSLRVPLTSLF